MKYLVTFQIIFLIAASYLFYDLRKENIEMRELYQELYGAYEYLDEKFEIQKFKGH